MKCSTSLRRHAFTVVELLVVIVILMLITAAAIPIMAPAIGNRRIREAARLTSTYISGARVRAIESGRPVGVVIEPASGGVVNDTTSGTSTHVTYSMNLSYAEVPPPWSGSSVQTRMYVTNTGMITKIVYPTSTGLQNDISWKGLVRVGDYVKIDYRGRRYRLFAGEPFIDQPNPVTGNYNGTYDSGEPYGDSNQDGSYTAANPTPLDTDGTFMNGPDTAQPIWTLGCIDAGAPILPTFGSVTADLAMQFQIVRQPVRSASRPIQLPEGVVIDMDRSGTVNQYFNKTTTIVFSPAGNIESYYYGPTNHKPIGPLFLLLGRRELMADLTTNGQDRNVSELTNLWIGIGHQTGLITTSENGNDFDGDGTTTLAEACRFAQSAQSMGGR